MRLIRRIIRLYQSFIISGVIVLFCLIAIFVGLIPGIQTISRMIGNVYEQTKTISLLQEKVNILNALDTNLLESYAAVAVSAVPTDKSLGTIFSTIDGLTTAENITVTGVSLSSVGSVATESAKKISSEEQKLGVSIVPFTITVVGPIENVRNVVDRAVRIRRLFRIRNFDLAFDNKTGTTRSTIQLDAYYVPLPKTLGKISDPLKSLSDDETTIIEKISNLPLMTKVVEESSGSSSIQLPPRGSDPFSP